MPEYARPAVYQDEHTRAIQQFLEPWLASGEVQRVLDAGCGAYLTIDFPRSVHLVGLDVSPEALARNENIDEALVGDLEGSSLPAESFDGIVCWTVLEHVSSPRAALANMSRALKPGGLLIVGVPNLWSFKGFVTKLTPHWFHVWVYRRVLRYREAGTPGHGPYKTYLRRDITPSRLAELADDLGLECTYATTYRPSLGLPRRIDRAWSAINAAGRALTFGIWDPEASEHAAVFRKR